MLAMDGFSCTLSTRRIFFFFFFASELNRLWVRTHVKPLCRYIEQGHVERDGGRRNSSELCLLRVSQVCVRDVRRVHEVQTRREYHGVEYVGSSHPCDVVRSTLYASAVARCPIRSNLDLQHWIICRYKIRLGLDVWSSNSKCIGYF